MNQQQNDEVLSPPKKKHKEICVTKKAISEKDPYEINPVIIMKIIDENINSIGLKEFKKSLKAGHPSHCTSCGAAWILVQTIHKNLD